MRPSSAQESIGEQLPFQSRRRKSKESGGSLSPTVALPVHTNSDAGLAVLDKGKIVEEQGTRTEKSRSHNDDRWKEKKSSEVLAAPLTNQPDTPMTSKKRAEYDARHREKRGCLGTSGMPNFEASTRQENGLWSKSEAVKDWTLRYQCPQLGLGRL